MYNDFKRQLLKYFSKLAGKSRNNDVNPNQALDDSYYKFQMTNRFKYQS